MSIEIKVPVLPESVSDATIATWHKKPGDAVKRDENLVDLETDKVVLEVPAPADGVLKEIKFDTGATVTSQQVLAILEEGATAAVSAKKDVGVASAAKSSTPAPAQTIAAEVASTKGSAAADLSPAGQRVASENKIDPNDVAATGRDGRVTKEDLVNFMRDGKPAPAAAAAPPAKPTPGAAAPARPEERVPMTRMRTKIAERLMLSKNSIAMLTSFNEINLTQVAA
ncbi:MAG: biotin/lipoyl-containing protein, partial [Dokdonella sp.]